MVPNEEPGELNRDRRTGSRNKKKGRTKIVEHVLEHEKDGDLWDHGLPGWKGYLVGLHTQRLCHGMEQPNLKSMVEYVRVIKIATELTAGNSMVKWEKRTCLVHSHCSWGVGILLGCSFHF